MASTDDEPVEALTDIRFASVLVRGVAEEAPSEPLPTSYGEDSYRRVFGKPSGC